MCESVQKNYLTHCVHIQYNVCIMKMLPFRTRRLWLQNRRLSKKLWGDEIGEPGLLLLRNLTQRFQLSIQMGEIQLIQGKLYVTHSGLLALARRNRCSGIRVQPARQFCNPSANRWVFKATVYKRRGSKGFVGYGDADPSNVSDLVRGTEMRVAETRAVNRALRKAYGIGLCSVEEIGTFHRSVESFSSQQNSQTNGDVPGNGQPRLRDRLSQLIRQHSLDPSLVKSYAADFCGTDSLRKASREQVESFINHLSEMAAKDRAGLVCQLNSYNSPQEVRS